MPTPSGSPTSQVPAQFIRMPAADRAQVYEARNRWAAGQQSRDLLGVLGGGAGLGLLGWLAIRHLQGSRRTFVDPVTGQEREMPKAASVAVAPTANPAAVIGNPAKAPGYSEFYWPLALGLPILGGATVALLSKIRDRYKVPTDNDLALKTYTREYEDLLNDRVTPKAAAENVRKYKYSTVQFELPDDVADEVRKMASDVSDGDLADDGRADQPHVTVKYGLHTDNADEVADLIEGGKPFTIKLGNMSTFKCDGFDVVKIDVTSDALHRLNEKISSALPHTDKHPEYQPHVTVACVKPGEGTKYAGDCKLNGRTLTVTKVTFRSHDGGSEVLELDGSCKTAMTRALLDVLEEETVKNASFKLFSGTMPALAAFLALGSAPFAFNAIDQRMPSVVKREAANKAVRNYRILFPPKPVVVTAGQGATPLADSLDNARSNVIPMTVNDGDDDNEDVTVAPNEEAPGPAQLSVFDQLQGQKVAGVQESGVAGIPGPELAARLEALAKSKPDVVAQLIAAAKAKYPQLAGMYADDQSMLAGLSSQLRKPTPFVGSAVRSRLNSLVDSQPTAGRALGVGHAAPGGPSVMQRVGDVARGISPIQYGLAAGSGIVGAATDHPILGLLGAGAALGAKPIWNRGIKPVWDSFARSLPSSNPALATAYTRNVGPGRPR